MKILALESSAKAASCAVLADGELLASAWQAAGLTHSRTLLPMVEGMLKNSELTMEAMDAVAVAAGPGSFTGLRIGVSAAKGLAWTLDKPCAKVSTLEAMAWNLVGFEGNLCPVMDARRSQVYNALFSSDGQTVARLTPDRAISLEELTEEVKKMDRPQILVGDGACLCYNYWKEQGLPSRLAPPNLRLQKAWGVARGALELAGAGKLITAAQLVPDYHRLSQAERERMERQQKEHKETEGE